MNRILPSSDDQLPFPSVEQDSNSADHVFLKLNEDTCLAESWPQSSRRTPHPLRTTDPTTPTSTPPGIQHQIYLKEIFVLNKMRVLGDWEKLTIFVITINCQSKAQITVFSRILPSSTTQPPFLPSQLRQPTNMINECAKIWPKVDPPCHLTPHPFAQRTPPTLTHPTNHSTPHRPYHQQHNPHCICNGTNQNNPQYATL